MKKSLLFTIIFVLTVLFSTPALANGDDHTADAEIRGAGLWEQMQNKEFGCDDLTDENFADLGEYFMGQMLGDAHEAMNDRMTQMMGHDGETQMHVIMGRRMSGCDTSAEFPEGGVTMMMQMMHGAGGGFGMGGIGTGGMMGGGINGGVFSNTMTFMWIVIGGLIVALIWALNRSNGSR